MKKDSLLANHPGTIFTLTALFLIATLGIYLKNGLQDRREKAHLTTSLSDLRSLYLWWGQYSSDTPTPSDETTLPHPFPTIPEIAAHSGVKKGDPTLDRLQTAQEKGQLRYHQPPKDGVTLGEWIIDTQVLTLDIDGHISRHTTEDFVKLARQTGAPATPQEFENKILQPGTPATLLHLFQTLGLMRDWSDDFARNHIGGQSAGGMGELHIPYEPQGHPWLKRLVITIQAIPTDTTRVFDPITPDARVTALDVHPKNGPPLYFRRQDDRYVRRNP